MAAYHEDAEPEPLECGKPIGTAHSACCTWQDKRGLFLTWRPVALRLLSALLRCSQLRRHARAAQMQQVPHRLVLRREVPKGAARLAATALVPAACLLF